MFYYFEGVYYVHYDSGSRKEYIFAATFAANLPRSSRDFAENPKQSKFKRFIYENLGQI
jgi:hypothetical protein